MKKLIALAFVALFSTATFAQNNTTEQKLEDYKKGNAQGSKPMNFECYMMKDGTLMHCAGGKSVAQSKEVVLKNGTVISPKGEVKMKDGKIAQEQDFLDNLEFMQQLGLIPR